MTTKRVIVFLLMVVNAIDLSSCGLIESEDVEEINHEVVTIYFNNTYKRNYDGEVYYGYAKIYFNDTKYYVDYGEVLEVEMEPGYYETEIYVKEYSEYYESEYKFYNSSKSFQTGGSTTIYID